MSSFCTDFLLIRSTITRIFFRFDDSSILKHFSFFFYIKNTIFSEIWVSSETCIIFLEDGLFHQQLRKLLLLIHLSAHLSRCNKIFTKNGIQYWPELWPSDLIPISLFANRENSNFSIVFWIEIFFSSERTYSEIHFFREVQRHNRLNLKSAKISVSVTFIPYTFINTKDSEGSPFDLGNRFNFYGTIVF